MQLFDSKPFRNCSISTFIFLFLLSINSLGANWNYFYCNNSENGDFIELEIAKDQRISFKTKESVYLLIQTPCQAISNDGPYLKCYENFGQDNRMLYSFSRLENGFVDAYSTELFNEKVFYITFERSFLNANNQYQQVKREFKFKSNDCVWE